MNPIYYSSRLLQNRPTSSRPWSLQCGSWEAAKRHFTAEAARKNPGAARQPPDVGEDLQADHSTRRDEYRSVELHRRSLFLQLPTGNGADVLSAGAVDGIKCLRTLLQYRLMLPVRRPIRFGFLLLSASSETGNQRRTKGRCLVQHFIHRLEYRRLRLHPTMS